MSSSPACFTERILGQPGDFLGEKSKTKRPLSFNFYSSNAHNEDLNQIWVIFLSFFSLTPRLALISQSFFFRHFGYWDCWTIPPRLMNYFLAITELMDFIMNMTLSTGTAHTLVPASFVQILTCLVGTIQSCTTQTEGWVLSKWLYTTAYAIYPNENMYIKKIKCLHFSAVTSTCIASPESSGN